MKVVQKLPDNRFSKSDAVMNDPRWTLIRQRLRLVPLLDSTKVRTSHGQNKRPRTSASDTNTPQCSFCNRPGHRLADCRDSARAKQLLSAERSSCPPQKKVTFSGSQKPHHKVNSVSTESDNKINLIEIYSNKSNLVVSDSVGSTVARSDRVNSSGDSTCLSTDIMIDSGCTTNSFCTAQYFTQYCVNSDNDRNVEIANNSKLTIAGSGSVSLQLEQPDNRPPVNMTLANAIHVPDLAGNYLSVSAAADKGLIVVFNSTNVLLYTAHDRNLVAIGQRKGNLYYFSTRPTENHQQQLNTLTLSNDASHATWHARLGHINPKNLQILVRGSATGMKITGNNKYFFCESCIHGKGTRTPFRRHARPERRATAILGRVSTDLCGPLPPAATGDIYLMAVLDQFSHFVQVYFLHSKSDAFEKFTTFRKYANNLHSQKIKILRVDGGGEFNSNEFTTFLQKKGITLERTMPHSSQENGSSERINRTLLDITRCMMHYANVPALFWTHAVQHAASSTIEHRRKRSRTIKLRTKFGFIENRIFLKFAHLGALLSA